jgi:hypothetical protein
MSLTLQYSQLMGTAGGADWYISKAPRLEDVGIAVIFPFTETSYDNVDRTDIS